MRRGFVPKGIRARVETPGPGKIPSEMLAGLSRCRDRSSSALLDEPHELQRADLVNAEEQSVDEGPH
jgi:hypothetical protein